MSRMIVAGGHIPEANREPPDNGERLLHVTLGKSPWFTRCPLRVDFIAAMTAWSDKLELTEGPQHVGVLFEGQLIHLQMVREG